MKKVVFGGFILVSGVIGFMGLLIIGAILGGDGGESAIGLAIFVILVGLAISISGLKKDNKTN